MLSWMRCLAGGGAISRRVHSQRVRSGAWDLEFQQPGMLETGHEIAIYLHRFHNLDLFQQGWYWLKISLRWEDPSRVSQPTPARVVQYEAPDVGTDDVLGVWKIDDSDHSFLTQPFRIKYARQDIYLSIMVSFNLLVEEDEALSCSSAILKFELNYCPISESGSEMQASDDENPASVHEFRIPRKALLGLHSYCPVHFDAFHAVLVDLTLHTVYLKSGATTSTLKKTDLTWGPKSHEIVKLLLTSREILLQDLKKISEAVGRPIYDTSDVDLSISKYNLAAPSKSGFPSTAGLSGSKMGVGQLAGILHNFLEISDGAGDPDNDVMLYTLPKEELMELFLTVSGQISYLWNAFLRFHRINRIKILDYLHVVWSNERKSEWSIWTIHSKIEMPHRYLRSGSDDFSHRNSLGKIVPVRKSGDDPLQSAASRAELHRKSIAQMKMNTSFIQDMQIFGDPSQTPIVLIEQHIMNVPQHGSSSNLNSPKHSSTVSIPEKQSQAVPSKSSAGKENKRILRAVVFVHGFQGHHLDLRLVRNQWLLLDPGADCLMSETNEERTSGDFKEMGSRLAEEVISFLKRRADRLTKYGGCKEIKLSFVGHSIGNIIIRSCLADSAMGPYLKHLYTYMSISGPHLGYWYSSNSLFNGGLWLLKKFKSAQCIHQLTFSDDQDFQNTFFYRLCKMKTFENFKNILLLSSPQDGYVPYHSARIELCSASSSDSSRKAEVFMEMLNNCLDQIRAPTSERRVFMRCDVNFDQSNQGRNLNTIIGRAAHIEFLETDSYAKFIMWSFPELFR